MLQYHQVIRCVGLTVQIPNDADIGTVQAVVGVLYSTINWLGIVNCITAMPLVSYERVVSVTVFTPTNRTAVCLCIY